MIENEVCQQLITCVQLVIRRSRGSRVKLDDQVQRMKRNTDEETKEARPKKIRWCIALLSSKHMLHDANVFLGEKNPLPIFS
jgi:hypothetical protein